MTDTSVLVTGGAGYIGSHTCVELLNAGYRVTVIDNLSNSSKRSLERVEQITGKAVEFIEADILDAELLVGLMKKNAFGGVIHFAGLKAVGESAQHPLKYYDNNVTGSLRLLQAMQETGHKRLIFSSSATVYGLPKALPLTEDHQTNPINPYGRTKLVVEDMLRDLMASDPAWSVAILRYFNPVGAHKSGLIGEDPNDTPNNLMPYVSQVAVGRREKLTVHGDDFETPDGTGVRDYIHVVDLARGHVRALEALFKRTGCLTLNLGTGRGYSVMEMREAFEKASGRDVPFVVGPRRAGDVATSYADCTRSAEELNWRAQHTIEEMCADTWRWQSMNKTGFD
ncbi:UDP-glucose 4-epimerase GalE [Asticcacaulis sp. AND118]|uniref:UDP-glucose 4-epimerase GalE n=1 Tax=Asticcacaulis sp. AND118 TaxID=2840468 RepID=UPI001CFFC3AF|nr:UDP-glucose 4-epimerase GalE [Asticcacaulis sp. AND118]UDF03391.1 UDP-glucose 4-epimerase GalE [Asticcacaulis sp. AND118]